MGRFFDASKKGAHVTSRSRANPKPGAQRQPFGYAYARPGSLDVHPCEQIKALSGCVALVLLAETNPTAYENDCSRVREGTISIERGNLIITVAEKRWPVTNRPKIGILSRVASLPFGFAVHATLPTGRRGVHLVRQAVVDGASRRSEGGMRSIDASGGTESAPGQRDGSRLCPIWPPFGTDEEVAAPDRGRGIATGSQVRGTSARSRFGV